MRGMVLRAHPRATLVDLGHEVPPQDIALAAFFLRAAVDRFPAGTVFAAVVDPEVGTARRALCVLAHACYWVGPDNGVLGEVHASARDAEARTVDFAHLGLEATARTFHGRDLFAPLCGRLAAGRVGFTAVGPRADAVVRAPSLLAGAPRVVFVDGFGNLVTNVPAAALAGVRAVRIGVRTVPVGDTYAAVAPGSPVAVVNSYDLLEVAVSRGSAAALLGCGVDTPVMLEANA
jgi:S-adenosylmethionine hydrolase